MKRAQGGGLGSRPGGSTARRTRPAPWWLRLELSTTTACAQRERPAARPHRRRRQQRALRQRLVMVDMLQLAARGVDELCARLVKGERERCKLQDATTKTLLRTKVRARARALLRMQLCSSVLLRSVVDLVPCRSHQLFAALLHGHARAEEATEKSHRRSRRSPRSRLPPPPNATTTLGYKRIQREHRASRTPCGK